MQSGMDCGVEEPCKVAWTDQFVTKQTRKLICPTDFQHIPQVSLCTHTSHKSVISSTPTCRKNHATHPTGCTSHTSHRSSYAPHIPQLRISHRSHKRFYPSHRSCGKAHVLISHCPTGSPTLHVGSSHRCCGTLCGKAWDGVAVTGVPASQATLSSSCDRKFGIEDHICVKSSKSAHACQENWR